MKRILKLHISYDQKLGQAIFLILQLELDSCVYIGANCNFNDASIWPISIWSLSLSSIKVCSCSPSALRPSDLTRTENITSCMSASTCNVPQTVATVVHFGHLVRYNLNLFTLHKFIFKFGP